MKKIFFVFVLAMMFLVPQICNAECSHFGGTVTCINGKICVICGAEYTDSLGHDLQDWTCGNTKHWKICNRCNCYVDSSEHSGGEASCLEKAVCSVCGESYGEALGHLDSGWTKNELQHWKVCGRNGCGVIISEKENHFGGTADLEKRAVCDICGTQYGNILSKNIEGDVMNVNKPELVTGMNPVKWNGSNWVITSESDSEWYNYNSGSGKFANVMLNDGIEYYLEGTEGPFATYSGEKIPIGKIIKTEGSMFVWVPRFTFDEVSKDIRWSKGAYDYKDSNFKGLNSFLYGKDKPIELNGIWVSKYPLGANEGKLISKSGALPINDKTVSELYLQGKNFMDKNFGYYGVSGIAKSHIIKNSEWDTLVYLNNIFVNQNLTAVQNLTGNGEYVAGYYSDGVLTNGYEMMYIEEVNDTDIYSGVLTDAFIVRGKNSISDVMAVDGSRGYTSRVVILPLDIINFLNHSATIEAETSVIEGDSLITDVIFKVDFDWKFGSDNITKDCIDISVMQEKSELKYYPEDYLCELIGVESNVEIPATINGDTRMPAGIYTLKIQIAGEYNGNSVFKGLDDAIAKIKINDEIKIKDYLTNLPVTIKSLNSNLLMTNVYSTGSSERGIKSIEVEQLPNKIVYFSGDAIDLTGGKLKVTFSNGGYAVVDMTNSNVKAEKIASRIQLTYLENVVAFNIKTDGSYGYVNVEEGEGAGTYIVGVKVKIVSEYKPGRKFVKWIIKDSSGIVQNDKRTFEYTVKACNSNVLGQYTEVSSMSIESMPLKLIYDIGDKVDLRGGKLRVYFEDGSFDFVDMFSKNVFVLSPDGGTLFKTSGVQKLFVVYGDEYVEMNVNVR